MEVKMEVKPNERVLSEDDWTYIREEQTEKGLLQVWGKGYLRIFYNKLTDEFGKVWSEDLFVLGVE